MKVTLDLTGKPSRLIVEDISHDEALDIITDSLHNYNIQMADPDNKLKYRYVPGPLNIIGKERWLRNFCELNKWEMDVLYPFAPMPAK
jgi:hypothetical protein